MTAKKTILLLLPLICLIFSQVACGDPYEVFSDEEIIKDYLREQGIDRRTSFFDVRLEKQGNKVVAYGFIDPALSSADFIKYLKSEPYQFYVIDSLRTKSKISDAIVNVSVCNVRSHPKHSAELVTQHWMGYPVRIYEAQDNWRLCKGPDDYIGWIEQKELIIPDSTWSAVPKAMISGAEETLYGEDGEVISDLMLGNLVGLVQQYRNQWKVVLPDGRSGFIRSNQLLDSVTLMDTNYFSEVDVLDYAYQLQGRPYLWGGTSTKASDCSGFTRNVYAPKGILLQRDASMQAKEGFPVSTGDNFSSLQKGDLLFFGRLRSDGSHAVTHVAVHIDNGRFIHSSGSVRIESLNPDHEDFSTYRSDQFLFARRLNVSNDPHLQRIVTFLGR